jgi:hypothetical protein
MKRTNWTISTTDFRDDPQLLAKRCAVGEKKAGAVEEGVVVRLKVFLAHVAPVTSDVALQELGGRLTGLLQGCQCWDDEKYRSDVRRRANNFRFTFRMSNELHDRTSFHVRCVRRPAILKHHGNPLFFVDDHRLSSAIAILPGVVSQLNDRVFVL